jgi:Helix-turn-helix domain
MHLTLSQAAKHVGINKATLSRYIKQGKISAEKQEDGSYHIDPSELDRLRELMGADTSDDTPSVPPSRTGEIALLRELWPCTYTLRINTTGSPADLHKGKKA